MQRTRRVAVPLPAGLSSAPRGGTRPQDAGGVAASFVRRRAGRVTVLLWSGPESTGPVSGGFIKVDGYGSDLFDTDRYVRSDLIAGVAADTVRLAVHKKALPRAS